jgi:hypothetical protein
MGIWGEGIFDNDACSDCVDGIVEDIGQYIRADLASKEAGQFLERGTLAAVACLRAIVTTIEPAAVGLLSYNIADWKERYISWLVESGPNLGGTNEYIAAQVRHAEREFGLLIEAQQKVRERVEREAEGS